MKVPRATAEPQGAETVAFRASAPNTIQDTSAGLRRLGRSVQHASDLAFVAENRRLELDADLQYGKVTQSINHFLDQQQQELSETEIISDEKRKLLVAKKRRDFENFFSKQFQSIDSVRARKRLAAWRDKNTIETEDGQIKFVPFVAVEREARHRLNDYQEGEFLRMAEDAAKADDLEAAYSYIDDMDRNEMIPHKEAVGIKKNLEGIRQKAIKEQGYQLAVSVIDQGGTAEQAIQAGKKFIPASDRQEFETEIKAIANSAEEKRVEAFKSSVHSVLNLPVDEFLAQWPSKRKEFEDADIDTGIVQGELKKGDDRLEALAKGEYDPIEQVDVIAVRKIRNKLIEDPASVKISDITGINAPTWAKEPLLKMKEQAENGEMTLQQKRALQAMDRIRSLRTRYKDTTVEEDIERQMFELTNEFINWSNTEEGRAASSEEVEKKLNALTKPMAEEVSLGLVQRLLSGTAGRLGAFIGIPKAFRVDTATEQLADERKGELKRLGIWEKLTKNEREDVYAGFLNGKTAQEFVDLYYAE